MDPCLLDRGYLACRRHVRISIFHERSPNPGTPIRDIWLRDRFHKETSRPRQPSFWNGSFFALFWRRRIQPSSTPPLGSHGFLHLLRSYVIFLRRPPTSTPSPYSTLFREA